MNRTHPIVRLLLLLLLAAACCYLLVPALDMPTNELRVNTLSALQAEIGILILSIISIRLYKPCIRINIVDVCAAGLFAWITVCRFAYPGLASTVKYDEIVGAALLYLPLRIFHTAERRTSTVIVTLLCGLGIYEGWIGLSQIYGFAYSNHSLFGVTGTFFNPGPYAGFIAATGICGAIGIVRGQSLMMRIFRSRTMMICLRPNILIWHILPYFLNWGVVIVAVIILPATMSRAAWIATATGGITFICLKYDPIGYIRRIYKFRPFRTGLYACLAVFIVSCTVIGAYSIKRNSADGRLLIWKIDSRILLHNPFGVGLGNFAGAFGEQQAAYFADKERPESEKQVAGCPEAGFNEFLQFGAETGWIGLLLLVSLTGISTANQIRRGSPLGYGLLTTVVFACFSYPWSVLPLRLLFMILLTGVSLNGIRFQNKLANFIVLFACANCFICGAGIYERSKLRVNTGWQWSDMRIWATAERYDYIVDDGARFFEAMKWDFRFLYDYGYALHKTGNYERSNEILKHGMQISSDPMFWIITGKNYEAMNHFSAAEAAYLHAHHMIPDRVYSLYLLAKLYFKFGQLEKALTVSRMVVGHTPKIESIQTREMQKELYDMLQEL